MAETCFDLSPEERRRMLKTASEESGRPEHLLEKGIWLVWCLETLFEAPIRAHLTFKDGISLSKAHKVIRRFSEDADIVRDIREIVPELAAGAPDGLPPSRSQFRSRLIGTGFVGYIRRCCGKAGR